MKRIYLKRQILMVWCGMEENVKAYLYQMVQDNEYMKMLGIELLEVDEGYANGRIYIMSAFEQ